MANAETIKCRYCGSNITVGLSEDLTEPVTETTTAPPTTTPTTSVSVDR